MATTATLADVWNYSVIADIGGTNARMQLIKFHGEDREPSVVKSVFYKTEQFATFDDCLADFVGEFKGTEKYPKNATLAVAAAPFDNKLKMINCHWPEMDGNKLGATFGIKPFNLINDFEAIGYAMISISKDLSSENLVTVQDAKPVPGRPMAVVGSGTGLGECVIHTFKDTQGKENFLVCPTEGGHKDFTPAEEIDFEFMKYCNDNIPNIKDLHHFSTEKAFCGPTIPYMYKFICKREGAEPKEIDSKEIFQQGLKKADPICEKVLHFYAKLYGREVGNFACDTLPYGGIYLVGGMINSIAEYFKDPTCPFTNSYKSKDDTTNKVLSRFPVYIVKYEELGLLGSFVKAQIDAASL